MTINQQKKSLSSFTGKNIFSSKEVFDFIKEQSPDLKKSTINWKIYKLVNEGVLQHISRGVYAISAKKEYTPEIPLALKILSNKIKNQFPNSNFCIWETKYFNHFSVHQLFKNLIIIEVEKDSIESVFFSLKVKNKKIFLNPDRKIFDNYINYEQEVIIIKTLISESPLRIINDVPTPTLEKGLVDLMGEKIILASLQGEIENIYAEANNRYSINTNRLRRYALRRGILEKVEPYIQQFTT